MYYHNHTHAIIVRINKLLSGQGSELASIKHPVIIPKGKKEEGKG